MRAAAVQLNSTADKDRNLAAAEHLVRGAAADGAELVVLPEKWNVLGDAEALRAGAEPLDGPTHRRGRGLGPRARRRPSCAGSIAERVDGRRRLSTPRALIGPDGEIAAVYRKIHMFDVDVGGVAYRESDTEEPGDGGRRRARSADERPVGPHRLLRPALPRALPDPRPARRPRDHRARGVHRWRPAATTGRSLLRARAIENQALRASPPARSARRRRTTDSYGHSMIVDPWGDGARRGRPTRRASSPPTSTSPSSGRVRAELPVARQPPPRGLRAGPSRGGRALMAKAPAGRPPPPDPRRRRSASSPARASTAAASPTSPTRPGSPTGSSTTTSSPRTQVLNELFTERWSLLLAAIDEVDAQRRPARARSSTRSPASSSTPTATTPS